MTEINPPLALEGGTILHPALLDRRAFGSIVPEGIARYNGKNDFKVTENSPAGMSVIVAEGGAWVQGDDVSDQGVYFVYNDGNVTKTVPAADATNPRKDIVVARVKDDFHGQPGDTWEIGYITGTPAASPAEPTLPATALKLAVVDVAASATSITNANITDKRKRFAARGGLIERLVFTANDSFVKADHPWASRVRVICIGGGGGGGGAQATSGSQAAAAGGGGGGGYSESILDVADLAASETITVGGGGAGGGGATPDNGSNGSASSFGSHVVANGGQGGNGATAATPPTTRAGGAEGTVGTGNVAMRPRPGMAGMALSATQIMSGYGADTPLGGGARGITAGSNPGDAGRQYGGGGGGAGNTGSGSNRSGGAGAAGVVIVEVLA